MKKIKRYYYYFYYKWYRLIEYTSTELGGAFWTDIKAGIALGALEIWFIGSLFMYYKVFINRFIQLRTDNYDVYILASILGLIKYLLFFRTDQWKIYFESFDDLSKEANRRCSWIVFGISAFIILNLIFSFYLMMQIDWSQYR